MFVPVMHHQEHEEPLSPRGRDLGERLAASIREFQHQYPGTSDDDLRGALRHAGRITGVRSSRNNGRPALAVIAGIVAAFLGVGLFTRASGGAPSGAGVVVAVTLGVLAAVFGVITARRHSS